MRTALRFFLAIASASAARAVVSASPSSAASAAPCGVASLPILQAPNGLAWLVNQRRLGTMCLPGNYSLRVCWLTISAPLTPNERICPPAQRLGSGAPRVGVLAAQQLGGPSSSPLTELPASRQSDTPKFLRSPKLAIPLLWLPICFPNHNGG